MRIKELRRLAWGGLLILFSLSFAYAQQFTIPGSFSGRTNAASSLGQGCYEITPNATNQAGAIWSTTPIDLANPFDISLDAYLDPWGADGMAFVLQSVGTGYVGHAGNSLGFADNISSGSPGIGASFAVELDVWDSRPALANDIGPDHLAIVVNGNHGAPIFGPTQALAGGADITNGVCREWRMTWDPGTNNFIVRYDGNIIFNITYNIPLNVFGGSTLVTWGVTGSTGGASCRQVICYQFADVGPDTTSCNGAPVQLSATGGNSYTWWNQFGTSTGYNNQNIANPTFTPFFGLTNFTLYSTVQNSFGCTDRDTLTLTVVPPPSASNAGPDQDLCVTNSTSLAGNNPANGTGEWFLVSGAGTIASPTASNSAVSGLGMGANQFEWVISSGSCPPERDTVTITVYPLPSASNAGPDQALCGVTTATLAGNLPASGTGTWNVITGPASVTNVNQNNSGVTGLGVGINTFEWVISSGPCTANRDTIIIDVQQGPTTANAGPDQDLCNQTSTTLAGNTATNGNGNWSVVTGAATISNPASPTSGVTGLGPGTNVLVWEISTGLACPLSSDTVNLTVWATPTTANAGPDQSLCGQNTATLAGNTAATGSGQWTVISGGSTVSNPTQNNSGVTGITQGTHVFEWAISNGPACAVSRDTVQIEMWNAPTVATAGPDQTVCSSDTVQLAGNAPAVGNGLWTFVNGSGNLSSNTDPAGTINNLPGAGLITLEWAISNGTCPVERDTVAITVISAPTVDILTPDTAICAGDAFALRVDTTVGTQWIWNPTGGLTAPTDLEPSASPANTTQYFLTLTDPVTSCTATDSITITVNPLPTVTINTADTFICNVDTVQLDVTSGNGADTWSWSPATDISDPSIEDPAVWPGSSTNYVLTVTNSTTFCQAMDSIQVDVFSLTLAQFADTTICLGDSIDLVATEGDIFLWTSTDPAADGQTVDSLRVGPVQAEDYSVFVIANFGNSSCSDSASLHVEVNEVQADAAPIYSLINPGQTVDLTSSGNGQVSGFSYSWLPVTGLDCDTCSAPAATPDETTTYVVTVSDSAGCSDTARVTVEVEEFLVPNVFTPNGDGQNEELVINYYGEMEYDTKIYDRWGRLVFETTDKQVHWNGKMQNSNANCPTGTYYLVLYIKNDDSIPEDLKNRGFDVTLIR